MPGTVQSSSSPGTHEAVGIGADEAAAMLLSGNSEYQAGRFDNKNRSASRRQEVAGGQHPFAIIVSCSDSRVPPEVVFNKGLGELFVVRTAGHVVDDVAIASIEYAVEHLGSNLILVLGHKKCGAVGAAVGGGETGGHLPSIIGAIRPAVEKARRGQPGDLADQAMIENVRLVREKLEQSKPVLAHAVEKGKLRIVGGFYDISSGKVTIMQD